MLYLDITLKNHPPFPIFKNILRKWMLTHIKFLFAIYGDEHLFLFWYIYMTIYMIHSVKGHVSRNSSWDTGHVLWITLFRFYFQSHLKYSEATLPQMLSFSSASCLTDRLLPVYMVGLIDFPSSPTYHHSFVPNALWELPTPHLCLLSPRREVHFLFKLCQFLYPLSLV